MKPRYVYVLYEEDGIIDVFTTALRAVEAAYFRAGIQESQSQKAKADELELYRSANLSGGYCLAKMEVRK